MTCVREETRNRVLALPGNVGDGGPFLRTFDVCYL